MQRGAHMPQTLIIGASQVGNGTAPADKTRMEYVVRRKSECRILVCTGQAHLFANRCQCT